VSLIKLRKTHSQLKNGEMKKCKNKDEKASSRARSKQTQWMSQMHDLNNISFRVETFAG